MFLTSCVYLIEVEMSVQKINNPRFLSIDALRGLSVAAMLLVNNAGDWDHVYWWLEHAAWDGTTPADFIFPLFLMIVGVSLYLAFTSKFEQGVASKALMSSVVWRACKIFALGMLLHVIATLLIPGREFRLLGVLQRIGICFLVAGTILIYVRSLRVQWLIILGILLGYWCLLASAGTYQPHLNLADQIDTRWLGNFAYSFDAKTGLAQEPEGILSTLPAIASVLFGIQAGAFMRHLQAHRLWQYGLLLVLLGWLWSFALPLNKSLWTSSFVLWTSGFAYLLIWFMHRIIDIAKMPAFGLSFGVNAIAAYAGSWLATCLLAASGIMDMIYPAWFTGKLTPIIGAHMSSLLFALLFTSVFAVLMYFLRRRGWRFSI
jgi:predicted acyltransferase